MEPATTGLKPVWKLEEAARKRPEKLEFSEPEWFQSAAIESEHRFSGKCYICGKAGHRVANCPQKGRVQAMIAHEDRVL